MSSHEAQVETLTDTRKFTHARTRHNMSVACHARLIVTSQQKASPQVCYISTVLPHHISIYHSAALQKIVYLEERRASLQASSCSLLGTASMKHCDKSSHGSQDHGVQGSEDAALPVGVVASKLWSFAIVGATHCLLNLAQQSTYSLVFLDKFLDCLQTVQRLSLTKAYSCHSCWSD